MPSGAPPLDQAVVGGRSRDTSMSIVTAEIMVLLKLSSMMAFPSLDIESGWCDKMFSQHDQTSFNSVLSHVLP